ncbi:MAG: 50S ribosomal protein L9 [Anaerolineaceae bacterium]|nr:50S ribosomal protein L9 [Anaerolineaceae bacterium]
MKVLLVKDVYKLGQAGDVKKVANGYGRNFLIPQGLAVLATPGALKSVEKLREKAAVERAKLNQEMGGLADLLANLELQFFTKAGESGKLYGSITNQMIIDEINNKLGLTLNRHQVELEPIRALGEHLATVRLTADLNPKVKVYVNREGDVSRVAAVKTEAKPETIAVAVEEVVETEIIELVEDTDAEEQAPDVTE